MLLTAPTHRALLVEDNPSDARLVQELLAESPDTFHLTIADRLSAALELLTHERFAVVMVDLGLPDATHMEALDALRASLGSTPVVVYSGSIEGAAADQARRLGVHDVLRKGALDGPSLAAALRTVVDGALFEEAVRDRLRTASSAGTEVAVIRLVVEQPPTLVAPSVEAEALIQRATAERLSAHLGPDDGLFDLGDHRYGVVAGLRKGTMSAAPLTDKLEHAFDRPIVVENDRAYLSVRTGSVVTTDGTGTAEGLLSRAAAALRASGALPKAVHSSDPPLAPRPAAGSSFSARLRHAIQAGELVLHYQPIVRLGDDNISVVEALVRWDDPVRGLLFPGDFIPQAEETNLIEEIGAWALMEACRQLKAWDEQGVAPVRCAVNLSARELCSASLPARVADALAATGLPPDRLEVELTESMFADPDGAALMIGRLRAIGVKVAIDDFGTGYSSLAYLTRFAVDVIKVDGEFVRRAAEDPDAAAVVKAIVGIAHQLDLEVVAEGVETVEQLAFARTQGCDLVQGWLFCEAMPGPAAAEWLGWARQRVADREAEEGELAPPQPEGQAPPVRMPEAAMAATTGSGPTPRPHVGGIVGGGEAPSPAPCPQRPRDARRHRPGGVRPRVRRRLPGRDAGRRELPGPGRGAGPVLLPARLAAVRHHLPGLRAGGDAGRGRRAPAAGPDARPAGAARARPATSGGGLGPTRPPLRRPPGNRQDDGRDAPPAAVGRELRGGAAARGELNRHVGSPRAATAAGG